MSEHMDKARKLVQRLRGYAVGSEWVNDVNPEALAVFERLARAEAAQLEWEFISARLHGAIVEPGAAVMLALRCETAVTSLKNAQEAVDALTKETL